MFQIDNLKSPNQSNFFRLFFPFQIDGSSTALPGSGREILGNESQIVSAPLLLCSVGLCRNLAGFLRILQDFRFAFFFEAVFLGFLRSISGFVVAVVFKLCDLFGEEKEEKEEEGEEEEEEEEEEEK